MPGNTFSWRYADESLIAKCPEQIKKNPNNAILNPFHEKLGSYIEGVFADLIEMFFPKDLKIRPFIHTGG